jgi:hypothetical protein
MNLYETQDGDVIEAFKPRAHDVLITTGDGEQHTLDWESRIVGGVCTVLLREIPELLDPANWDRWTLVTRG